ncbi:MAG: peptidoglycan DD-metalloendopeptidase family protein [Gammaproteobacteria bacterium]|nr:peptidoglycan DD-metalloendopeptidase family protein [Gammaproteobacteria bacterium]
MNRGLIVVAVAAAVLATAELPGAPPPPPPPPAPPGREAREAELGGVRQRIEEVRGRLEETRTVREGLQEELRAAELAGSQLAMELRQTEKAIGAVRARTDTLAREREGLEKALAAQRRLLARLVRADYAGGRHDYLALLLNQKDPSRLSRILTYHRQVERARAAEVERLRAQLSALAQVEDALAREEESLRALQAEKTAGQRELAEQRRARQAVLARLAAELRASGAELERLTTSAKQLERVIAGLSQALSDIPEGAGERRRFIDSRGSLPWPASGRVRAGFGAPRAGGLTWQGVVIEAPAGSPVLAVHPGRVAFADWLRGFGLLLIVDHGEGFMTLYGQNQGLLRQAGDWVEAGEAVATVGDTGGSSETGLYFEVRQKGTPLNPALWCRGNPGRG